MEKVNSTPISCLSEGDYFTHPNCETPEPMLGSSPSVEFSNEACSGSKLSTSSQTIIVLGNQAFDVFSVSRKFGFASIEARKPLSAVSKYTRSLTHYSLHVIVLRPTEFCQHSSHMHICWIRHAEERKHGISNDIHCRR